MALTPRQMMLIEAAMQPGLNRTVESICKAADVSRATYYRWLQKDAEFRESWEAAWRGSLRRHLPGVVAAVIQKALAGDMRAARLVADMAGATPDTAIWHTANDWDERSGDASAGE